MAQLFRKRSNTISRVSIVGGILLLIATGWAIDRLKWSSYATEVEAPLAQPVPFSHQHHVSGLGIDCRYCHTSVEYSSNAGMPATETCMSCHSQIWTNAEMLAPVRDSYAKDVPLQWNRIYRLPDFVYFDHSAHVSQGIGCVSCHGQIDQMPLTWKAKPFYMKDCLECHRAPEKFIRPRNEVFNLQWKAPPDQIEMGHRLIREHGIQTEHLMDCYTCHR